MKRSLIIVCILISGLLVCGCTYVNPSGKAGIYGTNYNVSIPPYTGGMYFQMNNETSKIYLINSTAIYGIYSYDTSNFPGGVIEAHAGDPCVIINGTLRNEYNRSYYIDMSAQLYDTNGKPVGYILTDAPAHNLGQAYAESNSTVIFSFKVKYDKKDVSRYEISAFLAPAALP